MPLRNAEGAKDAASGTASLITRQLALGGIALVWIIKVGKPEAAGIAWHQHLFLPLVMFALALVFDLGQYVWGALAWTRFFSRCEDDGKGLDDLVSAPGSINTVTAIFFSAKIVTVLTGYIALLVYMFSSLNR
jgi:hypothetical protein